MRPVTKANPTTIVPNYPFYTVLSLNQNEYFNANSATARAYNNDTVTGANRTVTQIQQDILGWDHGPGAGVDPFHAGASAADKTAAIRAMKDRLATLYRPANVHLTAQLGDYCSYCEIYYPGHELDVEHSIPKSPYPLRTVWWDNFLQGCGRCNSAKGQKPSRANAILWTGVVGPNETQIMTAALGHYFWPELTADSFRRLTYELRDADNFYALIPIAAAVGQYANVAFANYAVRADVQLLAGAALTAGRHVEVTVAPSATVAGALPQTADQLANVGLDTRDTARAGYRTRTWYNVLTAIDFMFAQIPHNYAPAVKRRMFGLAWTMFMFGARTMGHYSTIVTVLQQYAEPAYNQDGYNNLAERFVHDSDPANAGPFTVWPGTNTAQVP